MQLLTRRFFPYSPKESSDVRLFCFPFAGGGVTIFDGFLNLCPTWLDLQPVRLPGRESRISEPLITDIRKLAKILAHAILPYLDRPFAFLGICYGALVAYELSLEIFSQKNLLPARLFLTAAPLPCSFPCPNPIHALPDNVFIERLKTAEGMPKETFDNPELLPIILPAVRGDFMAIENYVPEKVVQPLSVPFSLFGGRADRQVSQQDIENWSNYTTSTFESVFFDGGHFFYSDEEKKIMKIILEKLLEFRQ